jgi:hypothetical protein
MVEFGVGCLVGWWLIARRIEVKIRQSDFSLGMLFTLWPQRLVNRQCQISPNKNKHRDSKNSSSSLSSINYRKWDRTTPPPLTIFHRLHQSDPKPRSRAREEQNMDFKLKIIGQVSPLPANKHVLYANSC